MELSVIKIQNKLMLFEAVKYKMVLVTVTINYENEIWQLPMSNLDMNKMRLTLRWLSLILKVKGSEWHLLSFKWHCKCQNKLLWRHMEDVVIPVEMTVTNSKKTNWWWLSVQNVSEK